MKLSVFYDHILDAKARTGKSIPELLDFVSSCGIGSVEVRLSHMEEDPGLMGNIRSAGLSVSSIFEFYDMGSCDETEKIRRHIERALDSGSKNIMIVPGFIEDIDTDTLKKTMDDKDALFKLYDGSAELAGMNRGMTLAAELGRQAGLTVLFEDFDDYTSPMSGLNGVLWFLDRIPGISMAFDTGNFIMYGEDVPEALEVLLPRVAHMHCKDRSSKAVAVGDGVIPIDRLVRRLAGTGYNGYFVIEHFDAADQVECIRRSAEYMLRLLP